MRKILSPVGEGFVLYEFAQGALDGVPTRVLAATPANTAKFEKHLAGRSIVAEEVHKMAMAAGLSEEEETNIGRTYPLGVAFGESESESAEELLAEEFAPEEDNSWWWPFWSEKRVVESEEDSTDATEVLEEDPAEEEPKEATKRSASKKEAVWQWLF